MQALSTYIIHPECNILKALEVIDRGSIQIAFVCDADMKLLGTVSDGDVRRGLLKGLSLSEPVSAIMNHHPIIATLNESRTSVLEKMTTGFINYIPIIDNKGCLTGFHSRFELDSQEAIAHEAFLVVGGLGSRLKSLTENCPKPLLKIGQKPLLEIIVDSLIESGIRKFFFAVNYKADMFYDYFGDGSSKGVKIVYIHEKEKMGTAGALSLLEEVPELPLLVMNGDILTSINYRHILDFHVQGQASMTIALSNFSYQVPYGVVNMDGAAVVELKEKPHINHFVNAGIYVLNPEVVKLVPKGQYFGMNQLYDEVCKNSMPVMGFPLKEYWTDIGNIDDFCRAQDEFPRLNSKGSNDEIL